MRSSTPGAISIAASTRKLDVDNRISLRYYYRIADTLLKQAGTWLIAENPGWQSENAGSSLKAVAGLITETIPRHKDYQLSLKNEKLYFKKKLLSTLTELETLKPAVERRVEELNQKRINQADRRVQIQQDFNSKSSLEWPSVKKQTTTNYEIRQVDQFTRRDGSSQGLWTQKDKFSHIPAVEDQFRKLSLSIPHPKEETLSRHSILGPNGLRGQWQPPISDKGVQYPLNLDLTPVEIPSLIQPAKEVADVPKEGAKSDCEKSTLESVLSLDDGRWSLQAEQPSPMTTLNTLESSHMDVVRQPTPPPVLAEIQDLVPVTSLQDTDSRTGPENSFQDALIHSEKPLELHISSQLMESFMRLARSNTEKNLETCGVLAGSLKNRRFNVTALIIPKQESTSDSCQTMNEEEIFDVQDKQSLFPLGWIHWNRSKDIMLSEAIAIVMAPKDASRTHGLFRLTNPGGMSVIRNCQQRGFHPHDEPSDGGPIYHHCSDVYMNPNLKFDVIDLR
ncbi:hypothetical protein ACLOJK_033014 [Asimina triloba]